MLQEMDEQLEEYKEMLDQLGNFAVCNFPHQRIELANNFLNPGQSPYQHTLNDSRRLLHTIPEVMFLGIFIHTLPVAIPIHPS